MLSKGYPFNESGFKALWAEFHNRALQAWDNSIGHSNTKIILWTSDLTNPNDIATNLNKDRYAFYKLKNEKPQIFQNIQQNYYVKSHYMLYIMMNV